MVNTCSTQYRDHHQTYGAATLQQNLGTELDQTGCLRALQSVYANACKLEQHSLIEVQVVNLEVGNALAALDYHVISEPTVEVVVGLVTDQTEYALLIAEVGSAGNHAACIALAAADNRGNDLVAYADGLACGIELHVLTNGYNLTGTLVTKRYGDQAEGVALPLVNVGAADTCALNLYQDVVIAQLGDGEFFYFNFLFAGQKSDVSGLGQSAVCVTVTTALAVAATLALMLRGAAVHALEDLTNDAFDLRSRIVHVVYSFPNM